MTIPVTTEAGKRLVKWAREGQVPWDVTQETVLAIEDEARALPSTPTEARADWPGLSGLLHELQGDLDARADNGDDLAHDLGVRLRAALRALPSTPTDRHGPGEHHDYILKCEDCGQIGVIRLTIEPERSEGDLEAEMDTGILSEDPPQTAEHGLLRRVEP